MAFTDSELLVDDNLGYPKAYAELCRNPYSNGPPHSYIPYIMHPEEASRVKDLNQMFPVINPEAKPSMNTRGYVSFIWKQLDHLGNAGFDPAVFRVDPYGNVLYMHADSASPLAWDVDHWFPCARGGRTVPSNLQLVQWQVCRKKQNRLDFLVPWWDHQLGISVNQFLSIFASRNSDFRNRAFSFLFSNGGSEELSSLQSVDSHSFPQQFINMKRQVGLAPAAIVSAQESTDDSVLKTIDFNRSLRHNSTMNATKKYLAGTSEDLPSKALQMSRPNISKENERLNKNDYSCNPHLAITVARDSLRQMEETRNKQAEINQLDNELNELKKKNEAERLVLQNLEEVLIKRRRRVEKSRRLAEAQSSYRAMLEKMIRDAMHQCVVYKEQLRLNTAASSSLKARLEAQREMADSSEHELRMKFRQRDEIEKQLRPCWGPRKRSRIDDILFEERNNSIIELGTRSIHRRPKKELRQLLEEAHKASEAELAISDHEEEGKNDKSKTSLIKRSKTRVRRNNSAFPRSHRHEGQDISRTMLATEEEISCMENGKEDEEGRRNNDGESYGHMLFEKPHEKDEEEHSRRLVDSEYQTTISDKFEKLVIRACKKANDPQTSRHTPSFQDGGCDYEDDEYRKQVGKGNIDHWLKLMLENAEEGTSIESPSINPEISQTENNMLKPMEGGSVVDIGPNEQQMKARNISEKGNDITGFDTSTSSRKSFDVKERKEWKAKENPKCESSRGFRSLPSSPSVMFGMRRGAECIGMKPRVIGDDDYVSKDSLLTNKFMNSCTKAIKKVMHK